jgi:REP element-mobilizing transposase RayT
MLKNYPQRKLNRMRNFDYASDGYYFITICVKNRIEYFGRIENNKMLLNDYGRIVKFCWLDLINHYWNCRLDEFIIMPNHCHGIIQINNHPAEGTDFKSVRTNGQSVRTNGQSVRTNGQSVRTGFKKYSLSAIIQGFKIFSSRRINEKNPEILFRWQRSFHDHIIHDEKSLDNIREYIRSNPSRWFRDRNNLGIYK